MTLDRISVVGGSGFIGSHVVAAIQSAGWTPVVVSNVPAPHLDCEVRVVDASNLDELTVGLEGSSAVVHLAARAGGIQMQHTSGIFRENRTLTDNVLESCARNGIKNVFLASSQVVYRTASKPLEESSPIVSGYDAPNQYIWSKATDEVVGRWWMEGHDARVVIGRFGNIYGPGAPYSDDRSTVVHALVRRFAEAEPGSTVAVWGDGSAVRSVLFVEDAARAVTVILENGSAGSLYNIDSGVPISIRELAVEIDAQVGNELMLEFDPTKPSGVNYRVGAIDEIRNIGFEPRVGLAEGLARTVSDFRSRH